MGLGALDGFAKHIRRDLADELVHGAAARNRQMVYLALGPAAERFQPFPQGIVEALLNGAV